MPCCQTHCFFIFMNYLNTVLVFDLFLTIYTLDQIKMTSQNKLKLQPGSKSSAASLFLDQRFQAIETAQGIDEESLLRDVSYRSSAALFALMSNYPQERAYSTASGNMAICICTMCTVLSDELCHKFCSLIRRNLKLWIAPLL